MRSFQFSNATSAAVGDMYKAFTVLSPFWATVRPIRFRGLYGACNRVTGAGPTLALIPGAGRIIISQVSGVNVLLNDTPQGVQPGIFGPGSFARYFHPGEAFLPVEGPVLPAGSRIDFNLETFDFGTAIAGDSINYTVAFFYEYVDDPDAKIISIEKIKVPKIKTLIKPLKYT